MSEIPEEKKPIIPEVNREMVDKACLVLALYMLGTRHRAMTVSQNNLQDFKGNLLGDFLISVRKVKLRESGIIVPK